MYKFRFLFGTAIIALGISSIARANISCDTLYPNPIPSQCVSTVKFGQIFGTSTLFRNADASKKQFNATLFNASPTTITGTVSWITCSDNKPDTLKQTQYSLPAGKSMSFHGDISSCPVDKRVMTVYQQQGSLLIDTSAE